MADKKPTFAELCEKAFLRQSDIVRESGLSIPTVKRMMRNQRVDRMNLRQALAIVNSRLQTNYEPEDIDAIYR